VSDPKGAIGDDQLAWFEREVAKVPKDRPLLVFTHRPLFALAQPWDWFTQDGERALAILDGHPNATVFYGHIHQAHIQRTNKTLHIATRSLVFPLPAPMSVEKRAPLPWNADAVDHGLGYRGLALAGGQLTWVERALGG
jgi:3',5'-cyclic AMP phosphodiesterase CpdA